MPTVNYIWDGQNVLQETDEVGAVQASYTYEPGQYGNLISQRRGGQTNCEGACRLASSINEIVGTINGQVIPSKDEAK